MYHHYLARISSRVTFAEQLKTREWIVDGMERVVEPTVGKTSQVDVHLLLAGPEKQSLWPW
jgi:hypothetical protein